MGKRFDAIDAYMAHPNPNIEGINWAKFFSEPHLECPCDCITGDTPGCKFECDACQFEGRYFDVGTKRWEGTFEVRMFMLALMYATVYSWCPKCKQYTLMNEPRDSPTGRIRIERCTNCT